MRNQKRIGHFIEPQLTPSKELAYILGVLKGDGCAYYYGRPKEEKRYGKICLRQIREEFAKSFKENLSAIGFNPHTYIEKPRKTECNPNNPKPIFATCGYATKFVQWYKQLSLKDIKKILDDNLEFIRAFIRGFYESEGTNFTSMQQGKYLTWTIAFGNTNQELSYFVLTLLEKLGFNFTIVVDRNHVTFGSAPFKYFIIRNSKKPENHRFITEINPCIKNRLVAFAPPKYKEWTKEIIVKELGNFVETNGHSPSQEEAPKALRSATIRHFGSWSRAKEAANIKVYCKRWSKERIIRELQKNANDNGFSPSRANLDTCLYYACLRHFGTFNNAKRAAGLRIYSTREGALILWGGHDFQPQPNRMVMT